MKYKKALLNPLRVDAQRPPAGEMIKIPYLQFPRLSTWDGISHAVYTRNGGVSAPPFHTLNASLSAGDNPERVRANLARIKAVLSAPHLAFMDQVHGKDILVLRHGTSDDFRQNGFRGDAMMTNRKGLALMVKQADCQSVILYDPVTQSIANVHCGWRGNRDNILGSVVERMVSEFNCRPADIQAGIGPSLGPCCAEFVTYPSLFPNHFKAFMERKNYFDLWEISRSQLIEAGLQNRYIEIAGLCTRCRTDLFYSYRGEGTTGRFATLIMLR